MPTKRIPHLPVQPLLPVLRRRIDVDHLGLGGFKSGIEQLVEEMGMLNGNEARSNEKLLVRILRGEVSSIRETTADRLAAALGLHPRDIWDEWYEVTNVKLTG